MSESLQPYGLGLHQALLSMGFSRQEYWGGMLFSSPEKHYFYFILENPFEQSQRDSEGQGSLACSHPEGHTESDTT